MSAKKILLTPGPCMTSQTVRLAGAGPDLNHRDPDYLDLVRETKSRLLSIYGGTSTGWHPYLLGGSGTLAVEAMVTSCIKNGPVLVLENGYYSGRIREIFDVHHIPYKALTYGWRDGWGFDEIERELANGYEAVIGTHNETTTGRLNDITRLGALCRASGTRCLVDAMSSFGADDIDFTNLDAVCSSGNKCLHSIPGLAFVLLRESFALTVESYPRRSYYMSLPMYAGDNPPLTPPLPALMALRQALREYPSGGAEERRVDYLVKASYLRDELSKRSMSPVIPVDEMSCTLSMYSIPENFTFDRWFEANLSEGFVLYGCKGEFRETHFQAANMGDLTMSDLQAWINAVDRILRT